MKQLLTWCGERALSEKPPHGSHGSSAILGGEFARSEDIERRKQSLLTRCVARAIQDQLLEDFGSRSEFSDWFMREDAPKPPVPTVKPNRSEHET